MTDLSQYYIIILTINTLLLTYGLYLDKRSGSPFIGFWIAYLTVYYIYSWSDWGDYQQKIHPQAVWISVYPAALIESHLYVMLTTTGLVATTWMAGERQRTLSTSGGDYLIHLAALFYILIFVYKYHSGYAQYSMIEVREESSYSDLIFGIYVKFLFIGVAIFALSRGRYVESGALIVITLFDYIAFGGSRQHTIIAIMAYVIAYVIQHKYRFRSIIAICIAFSVFLIAPRMMTYLRNLPDMDTRLAFLMHGNWNAAFDGTSDETQLRFLLYYFVGMTNPPPEFFQYDYFLRIMLFWLPSFVWNIKPGDFEYTMFREIFPQMEGTAHSTFFGSAYADTGWNVIPWLAMFGVARLVWKLLANRLPDSGYWIVWFGFFYLSVMWARGSIYAPIVVVFFIMTVVWLVPASSKRG